MFRERVTPPKKLMAGQYGRLKDDVVTYSQYPGLDRGAKATVVHISKITPAAPPCMTPLMLP